MTPLSDAMIDYLIQNEIDRHEIWLEEQAEQQQQQQAQLTEKDHDQ